MKKILWTLLLFIAAVILLAHVFGRTYHPDVILGPGFEGKFAEIDGVPIRYQQQGAGPDVLLIHGAMGSVEDWEILMPALSKRYRVTAFDRVGHGFSGGFERRAGIVVNAQFTRKLMEQLQLNDAVVVGHSYGGAVALRLAIDNDPAIRGIVLLAPVAYPDDESKFSWMEWALSNPYVGVGALRAMTLFATQRMIEERLHKAAAPDSAFLPQDFFSKRVAMWNRTATLYSRTQQTVRLNGELTAMSSRYAGITKKVRILIGEKDPFIGIIAGVRRLSVTLKAKATDLPEAGHYIQYVQPQQVIKAIDSMVVPYYERLDR